MKISNEYIIWVSLHLEIDKINTKFHYYKLIL